MSAFRSKSAKGSLLLSALLTFVACPAAVAQTDGAARQTAAASVQTTRAAAPLAAPADAPLNAADAAMRDGRFADAARQYEVWLKSHPDAGGVLLALGICYVQLGRREDAVSTLRRHLKLAPGSAAGHAALGVALLDGARDTEAKAELETAVRLNPRQRDAVGALARIYLTEGKAAGAVALLRPLAASVPDEETRLLLADALVKSGQSREAAEMLERELRADPRSSPQVYAAAGWARLKSGDLAAAAELCERGMRIYPDSEIEAVYLSLPAPLLAERIGERIKRLQESPDAAELIAVGRVLTDADPARKTRANEIAQRLLAHAVTLAPGSASAHYNYGRALAQTDAQRARAEWEKALSLNPPDELRLKILVEVGAAGLDLSNYDAAERAFREALEVNRRLARHSPEAALDYVSFLQLRSRSAEAEALLDEVLGWNPLSPQAHLERAKLFAARAEWASVVEEGEFVLRNAGDDVELLRAAHFLLVRAHRRLNQPEKARQHQAWLEEHQSAALP
ncbi:MAG TPA: tetratricopeptide repeat protein [Pyrinomonadaceae bacterium]|nr:tetratricopeptide repeat protein [Pyrinomonadaceae bacterium]